MPKKPSPYFICNRTQGSRFFTYDFGPTEDFQWNEATAGELDDAPESSRLFLQRIRAVYSSYTELLKPLIKKTALSKSSRVNLLPKNTIVKIDIDELQALDVLDLNTVTISGFVGAMGDEIYRFLKNNKLAINFREYFFIEKGQALPPHYRDGIDVCCDTLEEYTKRTSTISYQFIKKLFSSTTIKRSPDKKESVLDAFIVQHYATKNAPRIFNYDSVGYEALLNQLPYHNSIFEAWMYFYGYSFSSNPHITLMLGPHTLINTLEIILFTHFPFHVEFTVILHNSKYSLPEEREKAHKEALLLVDKTKCANLLNIILLTTKDINYSLHTLAPVFINPEDAFSPLAQEAGYYLSSPEFFSQIISHRRTIDSKNYNPYYLRSYYQSQPMEKNTYIYSHQKTEAYRKSKGLNREALINNRTLSLIHQQQLNQAQEVSQTQEITQTQQTNQEQEVSTNAAYNASQNHNYAWYTPLDFKSFCEALRIAALLKLDEETKAEHCLKQIYFTRRYYESAGADYYLREIANNEHFRMRVAAKFFSMAYIEKGGNSEVIQLPHESMHGVRERYIEKLINKSQLYTTFRDGISPDKRALKTSYFHYYTRVLDYVYIREKDYEYIEAIYSRAAPSQLALLYHNYDAYLQPYILLSDKDLQHTSIDQRALLISYANNLLKLFKKRMPHDPVLVHKQEKELVELIKFYFAHNANAAKYLAILNSLFNLFEEHNDDNLRALIQIIISGHKQKLEYFFNFLIQLNSKGALKHFYQIYFKYTKNITLVDQILNKIDYAPHYPNSEGNKNLFVDLFIHTPIVSSSQDWPLFEKFCYHTLVFAAINNHYTFGEYSYIELKQFWQRLSLKFLAYSNQNAAKSQELLSIFVTHLIAEEGLTIAPLNTRETLFEVLEQLIDHAIHNNTLKEQLEEMKGLSFLWTDVPYAIKFNQFLVVCDEMKLYGQEINPQTKKYSISPSELAEAISNHRPKNDFLKTAVFRYLGQEPQRHELSFYRELYKKTHEQEYDTQTYIKEIIFGFYIKNFTGAHYQRAFKKDEIATEFVLFLQDMPGSEALKETVMIQFDRACTEFFEQYNLLYNNKKKEETTLWALWQASGLNPLIDEQKQIPKILIQKFALAELTAFLTRNTKTLNECLPLLRKDSELVYGLIKCWLANDHKATFNKTSFTLLRYLYPQLSMTVLLHKLQQIAHFIEAYKLLIHYGARGNIYVAFEHLIKDHKKIDLAIEVIELLSKELGQNNTHRKRDLLGAKFLIELRKRPAFIKNIKATKPLLSLILSHYLNSTIKNESASLLFNLGSQVQSLKENAPLVLKQLLAYMADPQVYVFFDQHQKLNAKQLDNLCQLFKKIGDNSLAVPFMQHGLRHQEDFNFTVSVKLLKFLSQDQVKSIVVLCTLINCPTQLADYIKQLKKIPPNTLQKLVDLHKTYTLDKEDLLTLLECPSIPEAITEFGRVQNTKNLERFDYDKTELSKKIAQIKIKKPNGEVVALSDEQQEQMLKDYEQLMSYMMQKPVLKEQGKNKEFSINDLGIEQSAQLFERLNSLISAGKRVHEYQLIKLALCCEVLYRTTQKFPRNTQIINLLNSLRQPGHTTIHEVPTGEGKSIIAALHAALLYDGKRSIDIVTENNHLAQEGLDKFKPFYTYLEIPYAAEIIEPQSPFYSYAAPGINYSTASNLALFRSCAELDGHKLTKEVDLLCDEIDATLTTLVQYRLATGEDPRLNNIETWALVYKAMLDFVKEKELFHNNHCDAEEDVANFINYFKLNNPKMELIEFIDRVNKKSLNVALDSALTALELEENIDYMVVCNFVSSYAAPIIKATKRPDARVTYSDSLQQLLHARLNNSQPPPRYKFPITPVSKTIIATSASNFFDFYRLNGGRIIGFTGTAGTLVELMEFYQQQGLIAYNYPTFYASKSVDLGLFAAMNAEDHLELIFKQIEKHKQSNPSQPILIITASPQETLKINDYLAGKSSWNIQIYNGYDPTGFAESEIITKAGKDNTITIANESLARGADINPAHPKGLLVINATTAVTASALRQIQGRAARNGKEGSFCSIINVESIAHAEMTDEEISAAFLAYQQHLSVQAQQQRAKTRLLEQVRYHLVNNCLLEVQQQVNTILQRQFGANYALKPKAELISTLSTFNEDTDRHYVQLLEQYGPLTDSAVKEFITARLTSYQNILNSWLPENSFQNTPMIEPLIPLAHLNHLKSLESVEIGQLALVSRFASKVWKMEGHKKMLSHMSLADKVGRIFDPYLKGNCTLMHALGEALLEEDKLDEVVNSLTYIEKEANEFTRLLSTIPVLGALVPNTRITTFITDYAAKTKHHIQEKKWDDLSLPNVGMNTILTWIERLNYVKNLGISATMIGSVLTGGPAGFLVSRFIMPTLISWLTTLFGKLFAGSESEYMQVIVGLTNISSDLSQAFFALSKLPDSENITVGAFLDNFASLFKNKALISLITKYFELSQQTHLIAYIELVPEFLETLEPYRASKMRDVITVATLVEVLHKACQFEQVKKYVEHTEFKVLLDKLHLLTPEFLKAVGQLSFKELVNLVKVLAHPEFFDFIDKLPAKASYTDLTNWLDNKDVPVSAEAKAALDKLMVYQSNGERIAADNKTNLLNLRKKFSLSEDKLAAELAGQAAVRPVVIADATPIPEPDTIPWKIYLGIAATLMSMIIYTIFFFSISVLLTSVLVASVLLYPYVAELVSPWFVTEPITEGEVVAESVEDVGLIVVAANNTSAKRLSSHNKSEIKKISRKYGFFEAALEDEMDKHHTNKGNFEEETLGVGWVRR